MLLKKWGHYVNKYTYKQSVLFHQFLMHIQSNLLLFYLVAQMPTCLYSSSALDFLSTLVCPQCSKIDSIHEIQSVMSLGILSCCRSYYHVVSLLIASPALSQ